MIEVRPSRLRETTLWVGAGLGLLSLVAGVAVMFFGFTFLIFRSGSMGPGIPTGSLALARTTPAAELESGDVVSVLASNGARITHRLVSATVRGDEASLILQGDANGTPDAEIYQVTEAERSIVSVPYAGYVVTVLLSPAGLVAAGCLSGMLFLLGFGPRQEGPGAPSSGAGGRHRGERPRERRAIAAAGIGASMAVVSVLGVGVSSTSAFFTDPAQVTTGAFTAGTAAPPTNVRCGTGAGGGDYVLWSPPIGATPTGYILNFTHAQGSGTVVYGAGATQGRPESPSFFTGNRDFAVTITAVYGSWSAESSTSASIRGRNVVLGTIWSC